VKCQVVKAVPPGEPTDACGAEHAQFRLMFQGDEVGTPACEDCALRMMQTAQSHGTSVKVERVKEAQSGKRS
jgi:hypothetical protein